MSDPTLVITPTSTATDLVLTIAGDVDAASAETLEGEIRAGLFTSKVTTLVLDLESVPFLDSTGLGVILGAHKSMREREGTLVLRHPNETIRRLLDVTQLTGELRIEG